MVLTVRFIGLLLIYCYVYEKDDTKAVDSMLFIDILRKDIKELDAKKISITYEFDTPLDSSEGSSVLDPDCVFCCDFYSCRVTRFAG